MRFWTGNNLDHEVDYPIAEVIDRFASAVKHDGYPVWQSRPGHDARLRWWLTDSRGFNVAWEEDDYPPLIQELLARARTDAFLEKLMWRREADGGQS